MRYYKLKLDDSCDEAVVCLGDETYGNSMS